MNAHVMHHLTDVRGQGASGVFACFRNASHAALLGSPQVRIGCDDLRLCGLKVWAGISQQLCHFLVNFLSHERSLPC